MNGHYDPDVCPTCGNDLEWMDCYGRCVDGYSGHDCGEDACGCLNPEDNVVCDVCDGNGGWKVCRVCAESERKRGVVTGPESSA